MPKTDKESTLLAIIIMAHQKIRGAVLIGMLGGMALYYLLGLTVDGLPPLHIEKAKNVLYYKNRR